MNNPDLSTFVSAVVAGDVADTLSSAGNLTVFAPNNHAFANLPAGTLNNWLKPEKKAQLVDILKYHFLPEEVLSTQLKSLLTVKTVKGKPLRIFQEGSISIGP